MPSRTPSKVELYNSTRGDPHRWRVVSTWNGKKISCSSEGHKKTKDIDRSIELTAIATLLYLRDNYPSTYNTIIKESQTNA